MIYHDNCISWLLIIMIILYHTVKQAIIVCCEPRPRVIENGIKIMPWQVFLDELWDGDIV